VTTSQHFEPERAEENSEEERLRYQDSIISANYNFQIEQLQLKHAKSIEEKQQLISALQSER
jgi:hypothetical protein